ncbi:hypothetical protein [Bradyrhizobium sp. WSM1417]|uniref:hypothetical protein n=1 Tax=Bradyrhizobium sp. WSM1417 TaxID=754500 RepID=UPI0004891233|nr:hypothetical protein [Bradyrhizobium sp. WSM1417]
MPDPITRVLLAALNAADDVVKRKLDLAETMSGEVASVAKALSELTTIQLPIADDRQNRFASTICLSMEKFKSAS